MTTSAQQSTAEPAVIVSEPRDGVRQLTLNRPERLNALGDELVSELHQALAALSADRACRAVVLTGAGQGFCAGIDLKGLGGLSTADDPDFTRSIWEGQRRTVTLVGAMRRLPQPIIAAVNGPAIGGGLALVLAGDVRLAADNAWLACAGRGIGLSASDMGSGWLLPRIVGFARAQELMLTARRFGADEALRIGLLADVVPAGELLALALTRAEQIAAMPAFATRITKEAAWAALETPSLQAAMDFDDRHQALLTHTPDFREAVTAFREKREPRFNQGAS